MEISQSTTFSEVLRSLRKRQGVSQQQLATELGVHRNTIGTWERGDYLPDSKAIVLEVARILLLNQDETRALLDASLTTAIACWYVPLARNPYFTGREEVLQRLHAALVPANTGAQAIHFAALRGMGGVGKTQTALEYAYRYQQAYNAVLWLNAETKEALLVSFQRLALYLQLTSQREQNSPDASTQVAHWLATHKGWLLIFDNVEDVDLLKSYLPTAGRGSVLVTTRLQTLGGLALSDELPPLAESEAIRLLLARSGLKEISPDEATIAQTLATTMAGLPLALDQAGAYMEETQCGLRDFWRLFQEHPFSLLEERDSYLDHPASVVKTFQLALTKVEERDRYARDLLTRCAFLAPDAIPEEVLLDADTPETLLRFNQGIKILLGYSLLRRDPVSRTLSIHRLVQLVLRDSLSDDERRATLVRLLTLLDLRVPADVAEEKYMARGERLSLQAQTILEWGQREGVAAELRASLYAKLAGYKLAHWQFEKAQEYWEQAIELCEGTTESGTLAISLCGLATLDTGRGRYMKAEQTFQRALDVLQRSGQSEHPYYAYALNGIAIIYREEGRYQEAEELFQHALASHEAQRGSSHPWTGVTLCDMAALYLKQQRYTEAEQLLQCALAIWDQPSYRQHPYRTYCLNTLAVVYTRQGKYAEVSTLLQESWQLYREIWIEDPYQDY